MKPGFPLKNMSVDVLHINGISVKKYEQKNCSHKDPAHQNNYFKENIIFSHIM